MAETEDVGSARDALQSDGPEILEQGAFKVLTGEEQGSRIRHKNLEALCQGRHSGGLVKGEPDVSRRADRRRSSVDAHADSDAVLRLAVAVLQCKLPPYRRDYCVAWSVERSEERVTR